MDLDIEPDLDCIVPGVYLGNLTAAGNLSTLANHRITHVLTVDTEPLPGHMTDKNHDFQTMFIQADDRPHVDLLSHFDDAVRFIDDAINGTVAKTAGTATGCVAQQGSVLVHCFSGVSRSATLVVAYIMKRSSLSVQEAVAKVKGKRPVICPNPGFLAQLQLYYRMGCQVDVNNVSYKLFKLENLTSVLKKGRNFELVKGVMAKDPGLPDANVNTVEGTENVYRCKRCRRQLFSASNLLVHAVGQRPTWMDATWQVDEEADEGFCSHGLFTEPVDWMEETLTSLQGKLLCPKCKSKVGSFNWLGVQCPCGVKVVPGFLVTSSKVDESSSRTMTSTAMPPDISPRSTSP